MERDFMGLNPKEPSAVGKEEIRDRGKYSAALSNVLRWPFLNKVSVLPHSITPTVAQEDGGKRIGSDPPASSGFLTMSAADAFDLFHKRSVAEFQNLALGSMKQQLHRSVPVVGQHSIFPAIGSVDGIPDERNNCKSEAPAQQLTIFYAGSVNVFDEISPEKAQAIMLLAGNYGSSTATNKEQSVAQAHAPNSKAAATDYVVLGRQNGDTPPCSALSSPMSVSSHPAPLSGNGSASSDAGVSTAAVNKLEPSNVVVSMGPVAAKPMMPSDVPQFRKASLARFLEKRKERVMNKAPYSIGMKSTTKQHPGTEIGS